VKFKIELKLKELDLYGNNIKNINVLEKKKFNDLEILDLGWNKISDTSIISKLKIKFKEVYY
jgi:Leucine-rich repeat (LRR) protein